MTETAVRLGGVLLPRLRWAKRPEPASEKAEDWKDVRATHLGMAFDVFEARLEARPLSTLGNANLLARLQELADYGFFDAAGDKASSLSETRPSLVRIHASTNGMLQNAFSSFVLYSIYKDMFRRGVQNCLTHVVRAVSGHLCTPQNVAKN